MEPYESGISRVDDNRDGSLYQSYVRTSMNVLRLQLNKLDDKTNEMLNAYYNEGEKGNVISAVIRKDAIPFIVGKSGII